MSATYQHLLVALDFSESSQLALNKAFEFSKNQKITITALHVVELPVNPILEDIAVSGMGGVWDEELSKQWIDAANKKLDEWKSQAEPYIESGQLDFKAKVEVGHPAEIVCEYAEQHHVDCILVGYHGHSALRSLIGSTSRNILLQAKCDVLNVKK